ncbi:hypothetical protein [Streptomyces sp. SAS_270]|uniref:hypothetical protein n=1 Tax=Streptomyces sp. SAS_270 TaxID=3412748 RepID=UPI00403CED25
MTRNCISGRALGLMGGDDLLADQAEIDGSYLLAAAPANGQALAPPGETYTAFTGELLPILQHGITGQPRELDRDTVYRQLRGELAAKGRPTPQERDRNTAGRSSWPATRPTAARLPRYEQPGRPGPIRTTATHCSPTSTRLPRSGLSAV